MSCSKFDLQLLYLCGSTYTCLSRSDPEIHQHVAGTLSRSVPEIYLHVEPHRQRTTSLQVVTHRTAGERAGEGGGGGGVQSE